MGKKQKKRARARAAKRGGTRARRADKYDLYEKSVQEPEADLALVRRIFKKHFARPPRLLREDFCGTAYFACEWVAHHPENRAWGIDLDPQPLEWGRKHHVSKLRPEQAARVKLIEGNVLDVGHEKGDVTVAFDVQWNQPAVGGEGVESAGGALLLERAVAVVVKEVRRR